MRSFASDVVRDDLRAVVHDGDLGASESLDLGPADGDQVVLLVLGHVASSDPLVQRHHLRVPLDNRPLDRLASPLLRDLG